jgi:hypothetical protein
LDKKLIDLLAEGKRRTPLNKQELVRRTLRLHLREVIESESTTPAPRLTTIAPWPRGALKRAYKRVEKEWDRTEAAAIAAQGKSSWED